MLIKAMAGEETLGRRSRPGWARTDQTPPAAPPAARRNLKSSVAQAEHRNR